MELLHIDECMSPTQIRRRKRENKIRQKKMTEMVNYNNKNNDSNNHNNNNSSYIGNIAVLHYNNNNNSKNNNNINNNCYIDNNNNNGNNKNNSNNNNNDNQQLQLLQQQLQEMSMIKETIYESMHLHDPIIHRSSPQKCLNEQNNHANKNYNPDWKDFKNNIPMSLDRNNNNNNSEISSSGYQSSASSLEDDLDSLTKVNKKLIHHNNRFKCNNNLTYKNEKKNHFKLSMINNAPGSVNHEPCKKINKFNQEEIIQTKTKDNSQTVHNIHPLNQHRTLMKLSNKDKVSQHTGDPLIECPNKCGEKRLKKRIKNHCSSCILQNIKCKYYELGCKATISRKDLQRHNIFCYDIHNLLKRVHVLEQKLEQMKLEDFILQKRQRAIDRRFMTAIKRVAAKQVWTD